MKFNPDLAFEPFDKQDKWQDDALKNLLGYLSEHSPFYQRLFRTNGMNAASIKSIGDLPLLPTTSKSDMQEYNDDFLCVPHVGVAEYTATSGTLGKPVTIALTTSDLNRLAYNEHQSFLCADGKPGDIYQLMLTLDRQFMAGIAYYSGLRSLGASIIRTGTGLPSMQWETIMRLRPNSIVAVPSSMLQMIQYAREEGIDMQKTPVEKAICIGENLRLPDFELNALGEKIYNSWPLKLYSTYASTEMQTAFTECGAGKGGHHQPDLIIVEITDEDGHPLKAGEYGEVVITTLGVEGMPLLRYRTGDICAYYDEPCACGRMTKRLSPIQGRKQQMIKYKGTTLYPPAIFNILNEISFIREYVVEVFTNESGTDEIRLHVNTPLAADDCEMKLRPALQSKLRVVPLLQFHTLPAIRQMLFPANSRKQVRFIDNRASGYITKS